MGTRGISGIRIVKKSTSVADSAASKLILALGDTDGFWEDLRSLDAWNLSSLANAILHSYGGRMRKPSNILSAKSYDELSRLGHVTADDGFTEEFRRRFYPPGRWRNHVLIVPRELGLFRCEHPGERFIYDECNDASYNAANNRVLPSAKVGRDFYTNLHILEPEPLRELDDWELSHFFKRGPGSHTNMDVDSMLAKIGPTIGKPELRLRVGPSTLFLEKRRTEDSNRPYMCYSTSPCTLLFYPNGAPVAVNGNYLEYFLEKHGEDIELHAESRTAPIFVTRGKKFLGAIMPLRIDSSHPDEEILGALRGAYPDVVV